MSLTVFCSTCVHSPKPISPQSALSSELIPFYLGGFNIKYVLSPRSTNPFLHVSPVSKTLCSPLSSQDLKPYSPVSFNTIVQLVTKPFWLIIYLEVVSVSSIFHWNYPNPSSKTYQYQLLMVIDIAASFRALFIIIYFLNVSPDTCCLDLSL